MKKIGYDDCHDAKPNYQSDSRLVDVELWSKLKNGCEISYASIYTQYFPVLYMYGLKLCAEKEIVKDSIHDLFVYIWNNRQKLADTDCIKFYLLKSIKRRLIDNYTKSSKHFELNDFFFSDESFLLPSEESKIIANQLSEEEKKRVHIALEKLTCRQRQAVTLKFYREMPNEEIAKEMAISVEGVYNLISKALGKCRRNLGNAYR